MRDYYYILGIDQSASQQSIKTAYHKLSIKFHPDKNNGEKFFEERFKQIQEAYDTLSNANRKLRYDADLHEFNSNRVNREDLRSHEEGLKRKFEDELNKYKEEIKVKFQNRERIIREEYERKSKENNNETKLEHKIISRRNIFNLIFILICILLVFVVILLNIKSESITTTKKDVSPQVEVISPRIILSSDLQPDTAYSTEGIILSLYIIKNDSIKQTSLGEVFIFGKYYDGNFIPITDWNSNTNKTVIERLPVLQNNKAFDIFYNGDILSKITINRIETSQYDCEEIVVGVCDNKITPEYLSQKNEEYSQSMAGWDSGKEIKYSLTNFFCLSSNYSNFNRQFPKPLQLDTIQRNVIDFEMRNKMNKHLNRTSGFNYENKFIRHVYYSNEPDPTFISVAFCSDSIADEYTSLVSVFKVRNNKFESIYEDFIDLPFGSWGRGFEFIDAMDIDSDNNPELIFRIDGYEGSGVVIYKYQGGKITPVLQTGLYGC